ncbi:hypothetical protein [Dactylosporangium sp. CA-139066]|uniref:hypothetical protein n=1 Tax=Dactylosporangium sp. CA-139066 TaxID=3239930 RepID=UPI003D8E405E
MDAVPDAASDVAAEAAAELESVPEVVRPPKRRRLLVGAAALVVVLLAAGGVVAWRVLNPDPRDVAKDYFARLAAGDATGAMRAIDKASIGADLPTASPLLSDAALRDPAVRPQGMTITRVARAGDTATMTVQYQAGGSTVTQTLKAQRQGRAFLLESPLVKLAFANVADKAKVTVNGIAVDPAKGGPAFPGAYAVTVDGNALFVSRSAAAVPSADAATTIVQLPAPSLSTEGKTKVDAAIAAALEQCAAKNFVPDPSCPSGAGVFQAIKPGEINPDDLLNAPVIETTGPVEKLLYVRIVTTVTKQPACTYTPSGESAAFVCADGVVRVEMVLTTTDGKSVSGHDSDAPLKATGTAALDGGEIKLKFE